MEDKTIKKWEERLGLIMMILARLCAISFIAYAIAQLQYID